MAALRQESELFDKIIISHVLDCHRIFYAITCLGVGMVHSER